MRKNEATVRCTGGELYLLYNEGGRTKSFDTGYDLSGRDLVGNTMFKLLNGTRKSETEDYTYKIDTNN